MEEILAASQKASGVTIRCQVLGAKLTTFAIGGPLQFLAEPNSAQELAKLLRFLAENKQNCKILGAGSNLLIADQGLPGWVIKLGSGFRVVQHVKESVYEVGAAMPLMLLSRDLSEQGFSGLEFAGGIPASLGGAVYMNAGAHGSEMAALIERVRLMDMQGHESEISGQEAGFSYRQSNLGQDKIVLGVRLRLVKSDVQRTTQCRRHFLAERKAKQPLNLPSAGSVFKNPGPTQAAGFLLDQAGLKGQRVGGAEVSRVHANWIVNPEKKAKAADVADLMSLCIERVRSRFGISLCAEINVWG
jgi:UDP-N-acetylmuramate dehydrogenase